MPALITTLLWPAELVSVILFLDLLSFICEVALANVAKRNTGEKTGLSPSAVDALLAVTIPTLLVGRFDRTFVINADHISSSCHKERVIKGIFMPYLHTVCMGVVTR